MIKSHFANSNDLYELGSQNKGAKEAREGSTKEQRGLGQDGRGYKSQRGGCYTMLEISVIKETGPYVTTFSNCSRKAGALEFMLKIYLFFNDDKKCNLKSACNCSFLRG